jgi:hypothetical protein
MATHGVAPEPAAEPAGYVDIDALPDRAHEGGRCLMSTSTPKPGVAATVDSPSRSTGRLGEGQPVSRAADLRPGVDGQPSASDGRARHFLRHLGEMYVAMIVGMMVLGMLDGGILAAAGTSVSHVKRLAPEVFALVMALNMTVGMTVWMRHRRHSWAMCAEMAGAMFVPAGAAIALFWCSVIHARSIGAVEMNAMLPAMIAVMLLRRKEYSQPVRSHAQQASG